VELLSLFIAILTSLHSVLLGSFYSARSPYQFDLNCTSSNSNVGTVPMPLDMEVYLEQEKIVLTGGSVTSADASSGTGASTRQQQQLEATKKQQNMLVAKRQSQAMSMAMKPGQSLLMNAFMMYMSGSQLNIWTITTVSGAIITPLSALLSLQKTFQHLAVVGNSNADSGGSTMSAVSVDLTLAKSVFIALNLVWLGIGLYKMSMMKLLPLTSADYTSRLSWKELYEVTSIPPQDGSFPTGF
jgi:ER membrane protein complex subunit 4